MAIERHNTNIVVGLDWIWEDVENEINTLKSIMLPKLKEGAKLNLGSLSYNNLQRYFDAELVGYDINTSYTLLYYSNFFGFSAYKEDYNSLDELYTFITQNETFEQSLRMYKLLGHHLLDYIKTAILLRNNEVKFFYSNIEPRYSLPNVYDYMPHEQDLEKLLILLCGEDKLKIISHLKKMQSFDYLSFFRSLSTETYFFVSYIKQILIPCIEVFLVIFENKEEVFNDTLKEAVFQHKVYYEGADHDRDGGSRQGKPEGWVSLLLCCACVIAHERGFELAFSSDYLPEWLIKGDFKDLELIV